MESSNKRLKSIITELETIIIDSRKKITFEKKMENYNKANLLVSEGNKLIDELVMRISNPEIVQQEKLSAQQIHHLTELLFQRNEFDDILYVIDQLEAQRTGLPTSAEIIGNVEKEVIYEEDDVEEIDL